jgi:hypothetical protein
VIKNHRRRSAAKNRHGSTFQGAGGETAGGRQAGGVA